MSPPESSIRPSRHGSASEAAAVFKIILLLRVHDASEQRKSYRQRRNDAGNNSRSRLPPKDVDHAKRHETTISWRGELPDFTYAHACGQSHYGQVRRALGVSIIMIRHTALYAHRQAPGARLRVGYVSHQNAKHKCYPRSEPQPDSFVVKPCGLVRLHLLADPDCVARFRREVTQAALSSYDKRKKAPITKATDSQV